MLDEISHMDMMNVNVTGLESERLDRFEKHKVTWVPFEKCLDLKLCMICYPSHFWHQFLTRGFKITVLRLSTQEYKISGRWMVPIRLTSLLTSSKELLAILIDFCAYFMFESSLGGGGGGAAKSSIRFF